jgi:hypothetical protein
MGWERRGDRTYYYAKHREGGRVRSQYIGTGDTAAAIAAIVEFESRDRAHHRAQEQRRLADLETQGAAAHAALADLECQTETAIRETLHQAGYHQHRGQWRRKRDA